MLNLAGYGSSDSEEVEEDIDIIAKSIVPQTPVNEPILYEEKNVKESNKLPVKQVKISKKRPKKLNINFLPEEIRQALTRGETFSDEDSGDEKKSSLNKITNSKNTTNLVSLLPPPQATYLSQKNGINNRSSVAVEFFVENLSDQLLVDKKYLKNTSKVTIEEEEEIIQVPIKANASNHIIQSDQKKNDVTNLLSDSLKPTPTPMRQLLDSITTAPAISLKKSQNMFSVVDTPIPSTIYISHNTHSNPLSNHLPSIPPIVNNSYSYESDSVIQSEANPKMSRKRDRTIEQELLQGNLGIFQDNEITEIKANHEPWNPYLYGEQQKREAQLQSVFNFGQKGQENMIAQPTKLQNRRHQINSLALQAANMELELMDARGARNKTKSETQAKYGW